MKCSLQSLFLIFTLFSGAQSEALTCNAILSNVQTPIFRPAALKSWDKFESQLPNFPKLNRESTHEDILDTIEEFRGFADQVRQHALALDDVSQDLLFDFSEEVHDEMNRFSIWYNETRGSWELYKTTRGIVGTASRVKAHYFEAKVGFLLVRSGFQNVRDSLTLGELRQFYADEDSLTHEEKRFLADRAQTEIDFIASRDGINYIIELKSYLPVMNDRFFINMQKTKTQMEKRAKFLRMMGLESNWKTVLIFEYEIEAQVMQDHFDGLVDIHFGLKAFTD